MTKAAAPIPRRGDRWNPLRWQTRIWLAVDTTDPDECWVWQGHLDKDGYGQIRGNGGRGAPLLRAHRAMYALVRKEAIPAGLTIDHLCRNKACVNPDHLEVVDHRTNILRSTGPAAVNAVKTHCIHGHEFTPENTYVRKRKGGGRICKTCNTTRAKERRRGTAV